MADWKRSAVNSSTNAFLLPETLLFHPLVGLPPEEREATKQPTAGGNAVKTMAHGHRRGNLRSQQQEQGYQDYGPRACEALTQPAPRGWRLVGNSQLETDEIPAQPSYISAKGARRPRW